MLTCEDVVGGAYRRTSSATNQLLINFVVVDGIIQVCQGMAERNRLVQPLWELSIAIGVVILLDMLPRTCVVTLSNWREEVHQRLNERIRGSLLVFSLLHALKAFCACLRRCVLNAL